MSIRAVWMRLPAAGVQQGACRMPHWRSPCALRMCTSMAQGQVRFNLYFASCHDPGWSQGTLWRFGAPSTYCHKDQGVMKHHSSLMSRADER